MTRIVLIMAGLMILPAAAVANLIQFSLTVSSTPATVWNDDGAFQRTAARTVWVDLGSLYLP